MKLQIASRIAVFAVMALAADPERQLSAAEIGTKYGLSTHHLAKVLHALGRARLVRSVRGAGGGYRFSGNAKRTTLLDVIQLFERVGDPHAAGNEPGEDSEVGRALRQVLDEIDEIAMATLGSITISTLLKMAARQRAAAARSIEPSTAETG